MHESKEFIVIAQAVICPEDSDIMTLGYFLWQMSEPGLDGEAMYGLRVDKHLPSGVLVERVETPPLTSSFDDAFAMGKAFAAGAVPPCVLLEMVEEWQEEMLVKA